MHAKILRLEDQVNVLMDQRTAFEKRQAESDQTIKELHRDVANLKAQGQQHHDKLDVCKRGLDDNARNAQTLEQRIKAIPGSLEPRFQHHVTRIDKIESLVRSAATQKTTGETTAAKSHNDSHPQYGHTSEHSGGKSQLA
jgi:chromosome segregation ATPase